jgi:uncharacterized protein YfaS (alpha-2-macroglobulin family)
VFYSINAKREIGIGKIRINAVSGEHKAEYVREIEVRPSSPRLYSSKEYTAKPGERMKIHVEKVGIKGANHAQLIISRMPKLELKNRLDFLIRYPYGCIEQTTSSVFPQLYLNTFLVAYYGQDYRIDRNIDAGIKRLSKFITSSGGLAYWPGGTTPSGWGNNYAGHFLTIAKKIGYYVPQDLYNGWQRYQTSMARRNSGSVMEQVYRVYLLSLSGSPQFSAMNLLKENHLSKMRNVEKWLLATAYKLAQSEQIAESIIKSAGLEVKEYREFGGSYGSTIRDRAIILSCLVHFDKHDMAKPVFREMCETLSSKDWYPTQTAAYALLAMGQYLKKYVLKSDGSFPTIKANIELPDKTVTISTDKFFSSKNLDKYIGKDIYVTLNKNGGLKEAYITLNKNGIKLIAEIPAESQHLEVKTEFFNEDGNDIDVTSLIQGTSFWGKITINRSENISSTIDEIAVTQIFPSGWEIENLRLSGDSAPEWITRYKINEEDYLDIRDDRINWFFDLYRNNTYEFVFKAICITSGEFILPPTQVQAMYDKSYFARTAGRKVRVVKK